MPATPWDVREVVDPTGGQLFPPGTDITPPTVMMKIQQWAEKNWKWALPTAAVLLTAGVALPMAFSGK